MRSRRWLAEVVASCTVLLLACSSSEPDEVVRPPSCELDQLEIVPAASVEAAVDPVELARLSTVPPLSTAEPVVWLVVFEDGRVEAKPDDALDDRVRRAAVGRGSLEQLQRCIDESEFVRLEEGSHSDGGGRCGVAEPVTTTVMARGSDGRARTVSARGLHAVEGVGACTFDHPDSLTIVYEALTNLRRRVAAVGVS